MPFFVRPVREHVRAHYARYTPWAATLDVVVGVLLGISVGVVLLRADLVDRPHARPVHDARVRSENESGCDAGRGENSVRILSSVSAPVGNLAQGVACGVAVKNASHAPRV